LNFRRVEKDKGIIADPPSVAAGKYQARSHVEILCYPIDRIDYVAIFGGTEVVDVDGLSA
jgi:hypothetical protein